MKALELILDSSTDGRSCPEWLEERLPEVRTALAEAKKVQL